MGRLTASPALSDSDDRCAFSSWQALCYLLNRLDLQSSSHPVWRLLLSSPAGSPCPGLSHLSTASQQVVELGFAPRPFGSSPLGRVEISKICLPTVVTPGHPAPGQPLTPSQVPLELWPPPLPGESALPPLSGWHLCEPSPDCWGLQGSRIIVKKTLAMIGSQASCHSTPSRSFR